MTSPSSPESSRPDGHPSELLLTSELLLQAKNGDRTALEVLTARYVPRLQRWASGRLPPHARSLLDTVDLVQETLLRTIQHLDDLEVGSPGEFQAYMRRAVLNRIRDQIDWARRRPGPGGIPESLADPLPSPLEEAIGADMLERYERALGLLPEGDQQVLHLRIELYFDYPEIAAMTGRPSPDAARMAVRRALRSLAKGMGQEAVGHEL